MTLLRNSSIDPTRSLTLRRQIASDMKRRFATLKGVVLHTSNTRHLSSLRPNQVRSYVEWFQRTANNLLGLQPSSVVVTSLSDARTGWWTTYIDQAYIKGVARAYDDTKKVALRDHVTHTAGRLEFIQGVLHTPASRYTHDLFTNAEGGGKHSLRDVRGKFLSTRVHLLATRFMTELQGATAAMTQSVARILLDGLDKGSTPQEIAADISQAVESIGMTRALTIANTEIVHAHADGQLDAMAAMNVTEVTVQVEWDTSHDAKVCPRCRPLQGAVFTIENARGQIPRHPNCRCAWIPSPLSITTNTVPFFNPLLVTPLPTINAFNPSEARAPKGTSTGGEWVGKGKGKTPATSKTDSNSGGGGTEKGKGKGKATATKVPEKVPSEKAARAKAAHKLVDKSIQRYAEEHNEPRFAKVLSGKSLPDSEPVDVETEKAGIELKTMVDNDNDKLTMDTYAQIRKVLWEQETGKTFHTVVSDDRAVYNARGEGSHDDSKRVYFYRRGIAGSARVGTMLRVESEDELKRLMAMPEDKLPAAARRTDAKHKVGKWTAFKDDQGKGFVNDTTGKVVRAKK